MSAFVDLWVFVWGDQQIVLALGKWLLPLLACAGVKVFV